MVARLLKFTLMILLTGCGVALPPELLEQLESITYPTYEEWAAAQSFSTGLDTYNSDEDNDNTVNLLEYAFLTDPLESDVHLLPQIQRINNSSTNFNLELSYFQNPYQTDLTYEWEMSDDLTTWSADNTLESTTCSTIVTNKVCYTLSTDITTESDKYYRLKVTHA